MDQTIPVSPLTATLAVLAIVAAAIWFLWTFHLKPKPRKRDSSKAIKYQLVFQIPVKGMAEVDALFALQEAMEKAMGKDSVVDGNDVGGGTGNIFVITVDPQRALQDGLKVFDGRPEKERLVVAKRLCDGDNYTVLYPVGFKGEFKLV